MTPTDNTSPQTALRPDERLNRYFSQESERKDITRQMFDEGAVGYDLAEKLTALGSGAWYRKAVLQRQGLTTGMRLLDAAAGTGLVTVAGVELVGPTGKVWALDPSPGMLAQLKSKVEVETLEAYAEDIPLEANLVDFVSMGYALRHVIDIDRSFQEYLRVLKPGGRVCIMEISRPASRLGRHLLRFHIGVVVPLMARLLRRQADVKKLWAYYGDTIEAAIEPQTILQALDRNGFDDVQCSVSLGIFREYTGLKPQPHASTAGDQTNAI